MDGPIMSEFHEAAAISDLPEGNRDFSGYRVIQPFTMSLLCRNFQNLGRATQPVDHKLVAIRGGDPRS